MLLRLRFERSSEQRFPSPIALMTQRRRLDHFLVERAGEAGADVRDGVRVRGVEADGPSAMVVDFDGGRLRAALVLGADGANGVSAKALGLGADRAFEVAYEGNLPVSGAAAAEHRGRVILEIGTVPGGYGWIFPKGDHLNVGVGGWAAEGPRLRAHLDRLCAEHGIEVGELTALRGHRLPLRRTWSLAARGRAAVVGDAAGLVDPLSGDGIFEAFLSAKLASEAALDVLAGREATHGALPGPPAPRPGRPRRDGLGREARPGALARPHLPRAAVADHGPVRRRAPGPVRPAHGAGQRDARALGPPGPRGRCPLGPPAPISR